MGLGSAGRGGEDHPWGIIWGGSGNPMKARLLEPVWTAEHQCARNSISASIQITSGDPRSRCMRRLSTVSTPGPGLHAGADGKKESLSLLGLWFLPHPPPCQGTRDWLEANLKYLGTGRQPPGTWAVGGEARDAGRSAETQHHCIPLTLPQASKWRLRTSHAPHASHSALLGLPEPGR